MTWYYQKELEELKDLPSPNDIVIMAKKIADLRDRALFICLYLTAGRVSEVVQSLYRKDINKQYVEGREIYLFKLFNRKNRTKKVKELPIPYDKEKELLDLFLPYVETKNMDWPPLFHISKTRAWQIIRKEAGMNPHFLRHLRLTHLAVYHDFNDQLLVKFSGWTDSRPSKEYMEIKWKDILQKY